MCELLEMHDAKGSKWRNELGTLNRGISKSHARNTPSYFDALSNSYCETDGLAKVRRPHRGLLSPEG